MARNVRLPNGIVIKNVPDNVTKEQVRQKAIESGRATAEDFRSTSAPTSAQAPTQEQVDTSRSETQRNLPAFQNTKSFGDYLTTLGSVVGTTATGALTSVQASGEAIGTGIYEFVRGDDDPVLAAIQAGEAVQEEGFGIGDYRLAGVPRDETALELFQTVGEPLQRLEEAGNIAGNKVRDTTGSTALGAATATAITLLPDLVGLRGTTGRISQRRRVREEGVDVARRQGVDPRAPTSQKAEQIAQRGRQITEGAQPVESLDKITAAVTTERRRMESAASQNWERLKNTDAYVDINEIQPMAPAVRQSLDEAQFDLDDPSFRQVNARLNELEELTLPGSSETLQISELVKFRKRINANQPPEGPARAANQIIKARFDEYLLNDFASVAINGDRAARQNWKKAIESTKEFKQLFESRDGRYRILRELTRQEVTPEKAKSLIFGANAIQGNKQAGLYVTAIKDLIGEDSPEFRALRTEATLDVIDPILKAEPSIDDLRRFVDNYERSFKKSPTVANELFGNQASDLRELATLANAAIRTKDVGKIFDMDVARTAARLSVGNSLAKNSAKIGLVTSGFRLVGQLRRSAKKRSFLGEVLGFDPTVPLIDKKQIATIEGLRGASVRAAEQGDEEQEED